MTVTPASTERHLRLVTDIAGDTSSRVDQLAEVGRRFIVASVPLHNTIRDEDGRSARAELVVAFDIGADASTAFTVTVGPASAGDAAELAASLAGPGVEFYVRDYHHQDQRVWDALVAGLGATFAFDLPPESREDDFVVCDPFEDEEEVIRSWFDVGHELSFDDIRQSVIDALDNERMCVAAVASAYDRMNEEIS